MKEYRVTEKQLESLKKIQEQLVPMRATRAALSAAEYIVDDIEENEIDINVSPFDERILDARDELDLHGHARMELKCLVEDIEGQEVEDAQDAR